MADYQSDGDQGKLEQEEEEEEELLTQQPELQEEIPTSQLPKAKDWCFTINSPSEDQNEWPQLRNTMKYMVYRREVGDLQGFVQYKTMLRYNQVKRSLGHHGREAHVEIARGTAEENAAYCTKDATPDNPPTEFGELPKKGERTNLQKLTKEIMHNKLTRRECAIKYPQFIHSKAYDKLRLALQENRTEQAAVLYINGPTSLGNSYTTKCLMHKKAVQWYTKDPETKWFDGYDMEKVILFDEFRGCLPIELFRSICDAYPAPVETRGAHVHLQATHYIIISDKHPEHLYPRVKQEQPSIHEGYIRRLTHYLVYDPKYNPRTSTSECCKLPFRKTLIRVLNAFLNAPHTELTRPNSEASKHITKIVQHYVATNPPTEHECDLCMQLERSDLYKDTIGTCTCTKCDTV